MTIVNSHQQVSTGQDKTHNTEWVYEKLQRNIKSNNKIININNSQFTLIHSFSQGH